MAVATFIGAYIVTAIVIPLEMRWVPHSWSFYETNVITNIIMATAMTWAIMPGMSRLLRSWLYASRGGTPVPVPAVARTAWRSQADRHRDCPPSSSLRGRPALRLIMRPLPNARSQQHMTALKPEDADRNCRLGRGRKLSGCCVAQGQDVDIDPGSAREPRDTSDDRSPADHFWPAAALARADDDLGGLLVFSMFDQGSSQIAAVEVVPGGAHLGCHLP